ncbi:hemin receptor, partial [Hoylesella nanceiensis]
MKKKCFFLAAMSVLTLPMLAQETYENTKLIDNDLNGTARYVGMGGAMDALGADLTTMGTNPAGMGLYRSSAIAVSGGLLSQSGAKAINGASTSHFSLDQFGGVYSMRGSNNSIMNIGINYRKTKNFNHILSAANSLSGSSQNKLSYAKAIGGQDANGLSTWNLKEENSRFRGTAPFTSQLDNLYYNTLVVDPTTRNVGYNEADAFDMNRVNKGYIGEFDFNLSGNLNDRVYLGVTFGLKDVHYDGESVYRETLNSVSGSTIGDIYVNDFRKITGTGFDIKAGVIFRPFENSPFRVGLSVASPTWYDLTASNETRLVNNTSVAGLAKDATSSAAYSYKVYTPWKFGLSLGHTIGKNVALGAVYEYSDYSSLDSRTNDDGAYYDIYTDSYYTSSHSDETMNEHTKQTLKGVSTLKLGAEVKVSPEVSLRAGYNYVSSLYNKNGFKNGGLDSYGSNYSSATD